jgi:hypothetical protein
VIDGLVFETVVQSTVSGPRIGAEQANASGNRLSDKSLKDWAAGVLDNANNNVSLAPDCADNGGFAGIATTSYADFLIPMAVPVVSADIGFIDLDNPAELSNVLNEGGPDLVAHEPSRLVRAEAHVPEDLKGAHAFLGNEHQMGDSIPIFQRLIRVLKDCPGQVREAIASIGRTRIALPVPRIAFQFRGGHSATARAANALWPAARYQVSDAIILSLKERVELLGGQLVDGFRTAAHDGVSPSMRETLA